MTDGFNADGTPIIENNGGQPPVINAPSAAEDETWWKEASEKHGFKSKEDVYKSWTEANKKISEDGEKLKNFQIFQDNVVPVLDVVLKDEEILKQVKGKMEDPSKIVPIKKEDPAPLKTTPTEDPDTKKYLIDTTVASFEQSHGIDKLDPETQKEVKAKIGIEFRKFASEGGMKVSLLNGQLEDAFALAVAKDDKLKSLFTDKEESLEGYGSMPSQPSAIDKDGNIRLTPEQEKVAERMPGGREAYIKGIKKIQGK